MFKQMPLIAKSGFKRFVHYLTQYWTDDVQDCPVGHLGQEHFVPVLKNRCIQIQLIFLTYPF